MSRVFRCQFGVGSVSVRCQTTCQPVVFLETTCQQVVSLKTTCQPVVFLENHLSTGGFPWKPPVNRWFSLKTTCQPVVFLETTCQQVVLRIWALRLRVEDLMVRMNLLRWRFKSDECREFFGVSSVSVRCRFGVKPPANRWFSLKPPASKWFPWKPPVNRWFSLKTTCQPVVFLENHLSTGGFPWKPPVNRWFSLKPPVSRWF